MKLKIVYDNRGRQRKRGGQPVYELCRKIRRRGPVRELQALSARVDLALLGHVEKTRQAKAPTIRGMLGRYLRHCRRKRKLEPKTIKRYERVLVRFADDFAAAKLDPEHKSLIGDCHLDRITYKALEDWQCDVRGCEVGSGTVNNEIKILKNFARQAIKWNLWDVDESGVPWLSLDHMKESPRQPKVVPYPKLERILKSLPFHIQLVLWTMSVVCDRPGALCAARWRDVEMPDLENNRPGWLNLTERKGGEPRRIPFLAGSPLECLLLAAVEQFRISTDRRPGLDDHIFLSNPKGKTGRRWTVQGLDNAIKYHLKRGRLPKVLREFRPYTIRHSLLTWAAQDGASTFERQMMAGHKRETTCLIYTHTSGEDTRRVLETLGSRMMPGIERVMSQKPEKWGPTDKKQPDHFGGLSSSLPTV